ncbi:MAG: molybdenum cofactor biosynthesis protein MoaE [Gammaproteobacteria bacterium]
MRSFERAAFPAPGAVGATATFVGTMRDFNEGDTVRAMTLEHYPGMTERHLEDICADARRRWTLLETLVVHRIGDILPGDPIVLVAVWSAHRAEAFEACRFIMEDLKSRAPFWKKETLAGGTRWVSGNTPGTTRAP